MVWIIISGILFLIIILLIIAVIKLIKISIQAAADMAANAVAAESIESIQIGTVVITFHFSTKNYQEIYDTSALENYNILAIGIFTPLTAEEYLKELFDDNENDDFFDEENMEIMIDALSKPQVQKDVFIYKTIGGDVSWYSP